MMGFIVFCILVGGGGSFFFWAVRQSARNPDLAERERRRRMFQRGDTLDGAFIDEGDDITSAAVADSLMRMADRYDNAGDTQAAEQARAAAEQARSHEDAADASRAAQDYLASVGAVDVVAAFSVADPVSSASDSGGSERSSDGGASSSWSDNS